MMKYIEKYVSIAAAKQQLFCWNVLVVDILDEIVQANVDFPQTLLNLNLDHHLLDGSISRSIQSLQSPSK